MEGKGVQQVRKENKIHLAEEKMQAGSNTAVTCTTRGGITDQRWCPLALAAAAAMSSE